MAEAPEISCVIPVYNDRQRLPRAVASVLQQGAAVQLILVDDGSTDGSRELIADMARADARVVAFPLPWNRGQGSARNLGVARADAPVVTFLDQDDEHAPGWYEHALGLLRAHADLAGVKGDIELMEVPPELAISRDDPRWPALVYSPMWNIVVRKVVYQALGGCPTAGAFRTREGLEDVPLVVALTRNFKVAQSERVATRHYVNPQGATAYFLRRTRVAGGRFEFLERTAGELDGSLDRAAAEYRARVERDLGLLRGLLQPAEAWRPPEK
jgi:glycosyltransferase involved in cell wall biosynthesis